MLNKLWAYLPKILHSHPLHPLSNITDSGPIEFNVSGSGEEYLDLAKTLLLLKAKITKANGTALELNEQVGPANLFLHAL